MADTRGFRRTVRYVASQWDKPWGECEWKDCGQPAEYRNQTWNMRLVETCHRHTPADEKFRQNPRAVAHQRDDQRSWR